MKIRIGEFVFNRHYVAFHFKRTNAYSAWEAIGVIILSGNGYACRYAPGYEPFEKDFMKHWDSIKEPMLQISSESLENYRKSRQTMHSVISPVITYYSGITVNLSWLIVWLYNRYVYTGDLGKIKYLIMMLKMKKAYFASIFRFQRQDSRVSRMIKEIKKEGYFDEI